MPAAPEPRVPRLRHRAGARAAGRFGGRAGSRFGGRSSGRPRVGRPPAGRPCAGRRHGPSPVRTRPRCAVAERGYGLPSAGEGRSAVCHSNGWAAAGVRGGRVRSSPARARLR
ncbi:hypothetical protein B9W64_13095 [Streptomyces sp. CS159]|nr:hypothetical protein B9W64_13095 [Streptomyces sp. CS159]